MKIKLIILLSIALITAALNSCTTYYMTVDSFKQQFYGLDSTKYIKSKILLPPLYVPTKYLRNPITTIYCTDKNGIEHELINSPSIEIKFIYGPKKKHKVFYFDRLYVNNYRVYGFSSRIAAIKKQNIILDQITEIRIQDGKKNYKYKN